MSSDLFKRLAVASVMDAIADKESKPARTARELAADLKKCYDALTGKKHTFEPGQLVQFKEGLAYGRFQEGPFVVLEVLPEPVYDDKQESSQAGYRAPLDIQVGTLDRDGDFLHWYYDSRRFEPYVIQKQADA